MSRILLSSLILVSVIACNRKAALTSEGIDPLYISSLDQDRQSRLENLTRPQGWLSVIGLHWLEEGVNAIGGAEDNQIIFPTDTETIGAYQKTGHEIFFGKVEGVVVTANGSEYLGGPVEVGYPHTVVNHGSLYWYIIDRAGRFGIRLKDTLAESRLNFEGLTYFPVNPALNLKAKVISPQSGETVAISDVLGNTTNYPISAFLEFELGGQTQRLAALDEGGDSYFVIFGDETNAVTSYGGGRFIYPTKPAEGATHVRLDFNLAQNPPCVFTDFATCPLPPEMNKLSIAVNAGERVLTGH